MSLDYDYNSLCYSNSNNKNSKPMRSNPHGSEASLTVATGGDISSAGASEGDFLLMKNQNNRPAWISRTISHEEAPTPPA